MCGRMCFNTGKPWEAFREPMKKAPSGTALTPGSPHPGEDVLLRFLKGKATRPERLAVVRHLLAGCRECVAVTRPVLELADEQLKGGRQSTMIKRATAGFLLFLFLPLGAPSLGQSLPGHDTGGIDQTSEESYAASEARRRARQPFEKWRKTAYIVLATIGEEFIRVRNPPHPSREIRHFSEEGRRGKKWAIEIWEGGIQVLTCGWTGDKAIGVFVVPTRQRQVWECGEKKLDASFFRVAKEDPLWDDVVNPASGQEPAALEGGERGEEGEHTFTREGEGPR